MKHFADTSPSDQPHNENATPTLTATGNTPQLPNSSLLPKN